MKKTDYTNQRLTIFELDIRTLQRAFLPSVILMILAKNPAVNPLRLKDAVEELIERNFPYEEMLLINTPKDLQEDHFILHVSVLYPLLSYMEQKSLIAKSSSNIVTITDQGRKQLATWAEIARRISKILATLN
jgi:DNA-binding PadR family transcriptional regulator